MEVGGIKRLEVASELGGPLPYIGPKTADLGPGSRSCTCFKKRQTGRSCSILNVKPFINEYEGITSSGKCVLIYQGRPWLHLGRLPRR